jgi:general secretion pathway protein K
MLKRRPSPRPRGAAILVALLLVALVSTLAAGMAWQQHRALEVESAERARGQAGWILSGALDWARLILREDAVTDARRPGGAHDGLDETWATPLAEVRLSAFLAADRDNNADAGIDAFLSGQIDDAQSKWNLRNLVDAAGKPAPAQVAAFERLCAFAGVTPERAAVIVQALALAWASGTTGRDEGEDDASRIAAGRSGVAEGQPVSPSRLVHLAWLGIDAGTIARLAPYADILPLPTPVNVNTAPREVLAAAVEGLDIASAEAIRRRAQPIRNAEELRAALPPGLQVGNGVLAFRSSWFIVTGRLRVEQRVLEEVALVERLGTDRGLQVSVARRERRPWLPTGP